MGNPFGRSIVVALTNKSGGGVIAGDVVIVDSTNNDSFTTTTTGAFTGYVGIAQQTIASNAVGLVLVEGYAALVNVNASVTRGNYGKTHTVVKQATDAGSSRIAGTFCVFLTGGTTPDALIWHPDLGGGSGLTDPMTTRGDIIYRDSSNVTNRLGKGAANTFLKSDGTDVSYGVPVLSSTSAALAADVTMTTAGTWYDGPSLSLGAFTYLVMAHCTCQTASSSGTFQARLYDGTTVYDHSVGSVPASGQRVTMPLSVIITPGGSITLKLQATGANNSEILKRDPAGNGYNLATSILAVRIG